MDFKLLGPTRLEIKIGNGFDGDNIKSDFDIDKEYIYYVSIIVNNDVDPGLIKNFSKFFRTFFCDYPSLNNLVLDSYYIGVHETFKEFDVLLNSFKKDKIVYGSELEVLDLGIISQRNCPKDKGVKYYLENLFGSGIFSHIKEINMNTKNGIDCDYIYDGKESYKSLADVEKNITNIKSIYSTLMFRYYGEEV